MTGSGQASIGSFTDQAPIVLSLLAWSRRFLAVFAVVGMFALIWSLGGGRLQEQDVRLRLDPLWQAMLLLLCIVVAAATLGMRRLARQIDSQIRFLGSIDPMTGLANRSGLMERLDRPNIAVLYLDLDKFKQINDTLGHDTGDDVIRAVAQRIRRIVRPCDLAARLGGDEFVIVVEDDDAEGVARSIAERIRSALAVPIRAERKEVFAKASIGVAVKSPQFTRPTEILRAADLALYRAKRQGRDCIVFFNDALESNVMHRIDLEKDLWRAMDRGELELQYLPEVSIQSGAIVGVEALVRWRHPDHGLLRPGSFIEMAEEAGSVNQVGLWVLETAARDWRRWRRAFPEMAPISVSVNMSSRQLGQADLVRRVEEVLISTRMDAAALKLEVEERALLEAGPLHMSKLEQLHRLGIRLVVDDFGVGHAPLSYIRQWPVQGVKIDRSLISNLEFDESKLLVVQAIITLGHDLGFDVTAVGIETPRQLSQLFDLGCDFGQGYYLSEPVAAEGVEALLSRRPQRKGRRSRSRAA